MRLQEWAFRIMLPVLPDYTCKQHHTLFLRSSLSLWRTILRNRCRWPWVVSGRNRQSLRIIFRSHCRMRCAGIRARWHRAFHRVRVCFYQIDCVRLYPAIVEHEGDVQIITSHPHCIGFHRIVTDTVFILGIQLNDLFRQDIPDVIYFDVVVIPVLRPREWCNLGRPLVIGGVIYHGCGSRP